MERKYGWERRIREGLVEGQGSFRRVLRKWITWHRRIRTGSWKGGEEGASGNSRFWVDYKCYAKRGLKRNRAKRRYGLVVAREAESKCTPLSKFNAGDAHDDCTGLRVYLGPRQHRRRLTGQRVPYDARAHQRRRSELCDRSKGKMVNAINVRRLEKCRSSALGVASSVGLWFNRERRLGRAHSRTWIHVKTKREGRYL